ncbi:hypothetical protein DFH07DRAFT_1067104 [Mycena maculata]|uniref:Uncharacterized protein n=1 Tax=Mycena maculata TaxID=230809 RepID=A0AAD7HMP1_9AGAR|nr:hypothetical protein DFH07DRAFT_1067104 [Mycena maculata]
MSPDSLKSRTTASSSRLTSKLTARALFQAQMRLVGHNEEYKRLRNLIRVLTFTYLEPKLPMADQRPESWDNFQTELKCLFTLFRVGDKAPARILSAVCFAKEYMNACRRGKCRPRVVNVKQMVASAQPPAPSGTQVKFPDVANTPHTSDVLAFLQGCEPSLEYLLPDFLEVGIEERGWIWAMQGWPRSALRNFLARYFNKREDGQFDEQQVTLQALLVRFDDY